MAAPCGWSLGRLPQAKAIIRTISVPTPETVYQPEVLGALATLQKQSPADYDGFYQRCKGQVNLNTLKHQLAQHKREGAGFTVIEGGGQDDTGSLEGDGQTLASTVPDVPINLKLPAASSHYFNWIFSKSGVSMRKVSENGGETITKVSYVPIVITDRIYNIDSGQEKAVVAFKTHKGKWRSVILAKSTIFDSKKIMCLTDSGLIFDSAMARGLTKWLSALEAANAGTIPDRSGVGKFRQILLPNVLLNYLLIYP